MTADFIRNEFMPTAMTVAYTRYTESVTTVLKALGLSLAFVVFLFMGMFAPRVGRVAESLLTPGYAIPEAYWGGVHDVIQLGFAFILNVAFYAGVLFSVFSLWNRVQSRKN